MEKYKEAEAFVPNKIAIPTTKDGEKIRKLSKMDTLLSFLENKRGDDSVETFWNGINDMKTFYFGLGVWCIGWNLMAIYIVPAKGLQFVPLMILGIFFIFSGFHCRYVFNLRRFKHVSFLLLFAAVYVFGAIVIFRDLLVSLVINFPPISALSLKKSPERIMNLGNIGLLLVALLCNCAVFKKIGEQIGIEIDVIRKEIKELKAKQMVASVEGPQMRRQISKAKLLQQISSGGSGIGIE